MERNELSIDLEINQSINRSIDQDLVDLEALHIQFKNGHTRS